VNDQTDICKNLYLVSFLCFNYIFDICTAAPKKYVPPAMRGRSEAELKSKFREDDELPTNLKQQQAAQGWLQRCS
jgi:hypothetical protein